MGETDNQGNHAFRERLAKVAKKVGSYYRLAKRAGVQEETLRKIRVRGSEPSRPILAALARGGGVSVDWLATGESPFKKEILEAIIAEIREAEKMEDTVVSVERTAYIIATVYPDWELTWDGVGKPPNKRAILSIVRKAA